MKWVFFATIALFLEISCTNEKKSIGHQFNQEYTGDNLNRIAFPIGGLGAGMFCVEGNGAFSHFSLRHKPDLNNRPFIFAALGIKGQEKSARILEGPVQDWRIFGESNTGNGGSVFGAPRFEKASFSARFPFANVSLYDESIPLQVDLNAWSPFTPADPDNSSLPVGALEYSIHNRGKESLDIVFSFHSSNLMRIENQGLWGGIPVGKDSILALQNGFILSQACFPKNPWYKGDFAVWTDASEAIVDYCWFRGGWFDSRTLLWQDIATCNLPSREVSSGSPGASIYIPLHLQKGETRTVRIMTSWFVPHSDQRHGWSADNDAFSKKLLNFSCGTNSDCCSPEITNGFFEPWYAGKFKNIQELVQYWTSNYNNLRQITQLFSETFFSSDLPPEVLEAVSANLTILKSPTVLRQKDGKLWGWEGCFEKGQGCCEGSCTHVWNYAQSICHLFPSLERSLRETEFFTNQNQEGHQTFRATLPLREPGHGWYAASDGQLGGILKAYREWRISADNEFLIKIWPRVKQSLNYCIEQWDPKHKGVIEEPHHNTYDIEFWGPEPMITGFYLSALNAAIKMGTFMDEDISAYETLFKKGKKILEEELYNGEFFFQKVVIDSLEAGNPVLVSTQSIGGGYSKEARKLMESEGPKYQYGKGCLSDGMLGIWLSEMCGLDAGIDPEKVKNHLLSVYKYNFKKDLSEHVNPQRASFAYGKEGGLLLCTWPQGDSPTLPFVYSNEVWTGIEYQVASHLLRIGEVEKGLDIVKTLRNRYDGTIRNPFDEYECGHWYARAMSSYALIQGLTGIFFDAVTGTMYLDSKIGENFSCFFSCETGFGKVGLINGKPFAEAVYGKIPVKKFMIHGISFPFQI